MASKKKPTKAEKKQAYDRKLCKLLDEYPRVLVAEADNVSSTQLAAIRRGIRGESEMLMGKNTLIRRCIKVHAESTGNDKIKALIPLITGNVGLIFTKADLKEVREEVAKYKVGAPARVGRVAPIDVVVPPGNTGLDPSQTSFFQVLNIPTKINKGSVEIVANVDLIKKGDKVGSSEAALLAKLGICPFSYGLAITSVYDDGSVFSPEVLDLTDEYLMEKFASGVSMVASLSLAVSYPTLAAAPHMFLNAYKNVVAVGVETDSFNFRGWSNIPDDLLSLILDKLDDEFEIMRGPRNVCLNWRSFALLYVFGPLVQNGSATPQSVVEEYRTKWRPGQNSEGSSSSEDLSYFENEWWFDDAKFDIEDPEPGEKKGWEYNMFAICLKHLKRYAATVLAEKMAMVESYS